METSNVDNNNTTTTPTPGFRRDQGGYSNPLEAQFGVS